MTQSMLSVVIRFYVHHPDYLRAVCDGSHRYSLQGEGVEDISEQDKQYAKAKLEQQHHKRQFHTKRHKSQL